MAENKKSLLGRIGGFVVGAADRLAGAVIGLVGGAVTGMVQSIFAAGKWAAKHKLGELGLLIGMVGAVGGFFVGMPIAAISGIYGAYKGATGGIQGGMDGIGKVADTLGVNSQSAAPVQVPSAQAVSPQGEAAHRNKSTVALTQGLTGSHARSANQQALTTQHATLHAVVPAVTVVPYGASKAVERQDEQKSSAKSNVKEGEDASSQRRFR